MYRLYSERLKDAEGMPEVYEYEKFSEPFRNQFFRIVKNTIEGASQNSYGARSDRIVDALCSAFSQEKGLKSLVGGGYYGISSWKELEVYVDTCSDQDFLDLMDFTFGTVMSDSGLQRALHLYTDRHFVAAIEELNYRLKQNGLGYEFQNGVIIRKSNTVTHEQIIKPALKLLTDESFRGAEDEYLTAFEYFRNGRNKDAILNAAKAFESAIKIICLKLEYAFDEKRSTAKQLIEVLRSNSFFPDYLQEHLTTVCKALETGAPTVRNRMTGHGQGAGVERVGDEYVEYVLNLVATNILFLYRLYCKKQG